MFRLFVERKPEFAQEAERLKGEITGFLGIRGVRSLRYVNRYDIENIREETFALSAARIFSEPASDLCHGGTLPLAPEETVIAWEYLPGQYDQRADSAEQCLTLLEASERAESGAGKGAPRPGGAVRVKCARLVALRGDFSDGEIAKIKKYLINPVDSREAGLGLPKSLETPPPVPGDIQSIEGFTAFSPEALQDFRRVLGLAMDNADVAFMQDYFRRVRRDPTETEVRILDTYWSDHCRHTTFNTEITGVEIGEGRFKGGMEQSLALYRRLAESLQSDAPQGEKSRLTLMNLAVIGARHLKKAGALTDLEESEEINACSLVINPRFTDGTAEPWLLLFKNETHNHPTEIEPFGGAATCIGGAIRDPLSGRAWVYQSMRVTGSADPRAAQEDTLEGKLPQIKITREAAAGFSSYGNQIGLATGQVREYYHPGFAAKRMELGAVIAAAPRSLVVRGTPRAGDVVLLVGGGTGRDGIGGATGSSKAHNPQSLETAACEVQKGNAVEERKIQRLFRNPDVTRRIIRCNDFGAGGVSVAVGELAPGLEINLDAVPKKYEGLNGTELAISESQERMALVVSEADAPFVLAQCATENLSGSVIARVTESPRLVMKWRGATVADIDRAFLDTAGSPKKAQAFIAPPEAGDSPLIAPLKIVQAALKTGDCCSALRAAWFAMLSSLACASQRGLSERFDGSIGAASVLFPLGGACQATPEAGMAAKLPALPPKESATASLMAHGYDPEVAEWSPWHGAQVAALVSLAKIAALGGDALSCRLSLQEYFPKTASPEAWGKPLAALLGALEAQVGTGCPAIGGKDSMSGTFGNLSVPPTLVCFAVTTEDAGAVRGGSFSALGAGEGGKNVFLLQTPFTENLAPDYAAFRQNMRALYRLGSAVTAAYPVERGGVAEALSKMSFGNRIGARIGPLPFAPQNLFAPRFGSLVIETAQSPEQLRASGFAPDTVTLLGTTTADPAVTLAWEGGGSVRIPLEEALAAWEKPLAEVFPPVSAQAQGIRHEQAVRAGLHEQNAPRSCRSWGSFHGSRHGSCLPRVLLPVFAGTNCEYDMERAFLLAGAETDIFVFRNNTPQALSESLEEFARRISRAQILALSGGFSAGDEPDGSGKYIANVLREQGVRTAVLSLLKDREGLILGICNGFQALIKTGLVPYGDIVEPSAEMPTLTFNTIGRHISRVARTRLVSGLSPWAGDESVLAEVSHLVPISHGEGRLIVSHPEAERLFAAGQVFTRYVDERGEPAVSEPDNPNGSAFAIEGLTSPCGRALGKMGHCERTLEGISGDASASLLKNIPERPGESKRMNIFAAGVRYFL